MKNKTTSTKVFLSIIAILLAILSFSGGLDKLSESYTQDAFNRALLTYGIARAINGVISVAQGTEIAVQPAGVGVNFAPGQILDPINDLVERFSWVMLAATASLGVQQVFINISSSLIVSVLFSILLLLVVVDRIKQNYLGRSTSVVLYKLLIIMLFIRFAVPLTAISSEVMYRYFLADQYISSTERLEHTKVAIGEISAPSEKSDNNQQNKSFMDKAADLVNSATSGVDISKKMDAYKETVEEASSSAVNLIVVFVVHTVFFPLLFLWALLHLFKGIRFQWISP